MDPRLGALREALPGQVLRGSGGVSYYLRQCIGEGGQGWVFTAGWNEPDGAVVIVKVLRPDAVSRDALRRFDREAEVLRMLSQQAHPNPHIVRFFDHAVASVASRTGETFVLPFTVLEYVQGASLEQAIAQEGRGLALVRVRRILRQVTQALEIVHGQRVVHRDLKPSNILLAKDAGTEVAKVTDFGLVRLVDVALNRTTTLAGASMGYAPPEQFEQGNTRVSERTDVFSLGAIAFEMLTGTPAFPAIDGENPLLVVTRIMNGPRPSLLRDETKISPELRGRPEQVAAIDREISRALSADPKDRHESVVAFWTRFEPHLQLGPERSSVAPPPSLQFSATVPASMNKPVLLTPARPSPAVAIRTPYSPIALSRPPTGGVAPAQWAWRVVASPVQRDLFRGARFTADGVAVGVGARCGIVRSDGGRWTTWPAAGLPANAVRGVRLFASGEALLLGEAGYAARLAPSGQIRLLPRADPEAVLTGAWIDPSEDLIIAVGERFAHANVARTTSTDRVGYVVQYAGGKCEWAGDTAPSGKLSAVTRLGDGWVAVGARGALVKIGKGSAEYVRPACAGDLFAADTLPDGTVVAVGAGGHALHLDARMGEQLEAVQTTRDLVSVALSNDGVAWAGAPARILCRAEGTWVRVSGELGLESSIIALWIRPNVVRAVCDDGAMLEGSLAVG